MRFCLMMIVTLLAACQSESNFRDVNTMPHTLAKAEVDLLAYPKPVIPGYTLQGDAKLEVSGQRVFLYRRDDDPAVRLQLAFYDIPPGWEDMPSERLVAGHFGQVRNGVAKHLLKSTRRPIELLDDRLVESDALPYPMGYAQIRHPDENPNTYYTVFLSAHQPLFLRMEHIDPNGAGLTPEQAVDLLAAVSNSLFMGQDQDTGNSSAINGTSSRKDSTVDTSTEAATDSASR